MRSIVLAVSLLCACAAEAAAKPKKWYVAVYLSASDSIPGANRLVAFDTKSREPVIRRLVGKLDSLKDGPSTLAGAVMQEVLGDDELAKHTTNRWVGSVGDSVIVYVIHDGALVPAVQITETARSRRIQEDFRTLVQLATKIGGISKRSDSAPPCVASIRPYQFQLRRATLKIVVTSKTLEGGTFCRGGGALAPTAEASAATGPAERFFLSANIGEADVKQTKYDAANNALTPPQQPGQFFVATNLSFGDILTDRPSWWNTIYTGVLVEGSRKPFRQLGAVLGTRYVPGLSRVVNLEAISPYVGVIWARNDSIVRSAADPTLIDEIRTHYGKGALVFGLSLNLSKATGWVGGS